MVGFGLDNVEMGRQIAPLAVALTDEGKEWGYE